MTTPYPPSDALSIRARVITSVVVVMVLSIVAWQMSPVADDDPDGRNGAPTLDADSWRDQTELVEPGQELTFEANDGVADPDLDFVIAGSDYQALLTGDEVVVAFEGELTADSITMELVDAAPDPAPDATEPEELIDPAVSEGVAYRDVYPGIDVVYEADAGDLRYSLVVDPGTDPGTVSLGFESTSDLQLQEDGSIRFASMSGRGLIMTAPVTFQTVAEERVGVDSAYAIREDGTIGFTVGAYDPALPLVIDPTFVAEDATGGAYAGASSISLNVPAGVSSGDLLLAQVAFTASPVAGSPGSPGGWTQVDTQIVNGLRQTIYWRVATGSEPASYSFNLAGATTKTAAGSIVAYADVDTTSPINAAAGQTNSATAAVVAPSITTTVNGTTLVAFYAVADDGSLTPPGAMTERWDINSAAGGAASDNTLAAAADQTQATAGPTGTRTATAEVSADSVGHLLALAPAGGGGGSSGATDLLMVTSDGGFASPGDAATKALFEGWGWTVTGLAGNSLAGAYATAAAANDVLFLSETTSGGSAIVADLDIGVVVEILFGWINTLYSGSDASNWTNGTALNLVDNSHYITSPFSTGSLTIHTSSDDVNYWQSNVTALPSGVTVLAESPTSTEHDAIVVAETGATLFSANTAPNRRVWFSSDSASPSVYTTDYETLLERSLDWAAGNDAPACATGDSDSDGLQDCEEDANSDGDANPASSPGPDTDGDTTPNYLDADDDGDGTPTASENPDPNGDGDPRDALDADRDGQPDYLDIEAGPSSTPVLSEQKITEGVGGFVGPLPGSAGAGGAIASIGDVDGDGVVDMALGVPDDSDGGTGRGAVHILFMNTDGTVRAEQKISSTQGGFTGPLDNADLFGRGVAGIGDIDGDGISDIAVGAFGDDDGGGSAGTIYILFLNADGTVLGEQKISETQGGLTAIHDPEDRFGVGIAGLGDLDGDGIGDIAVAAPRDDDGGPDRGAIYILFLNGDGSVKTEQKISQSGGGGPGLDDDDQFGLAVGSIGDVDGDGVVDMIVGLRNDDDGGTDRGAAYILFLNANGTVKAEQKISDVIGGLSASLANSDNFGSGVSGVGDLDADGTPDVLVGASGNDNGGTDRGAAYILLLNSDGTVKAEQKISDTVGGLGTTLDNTDYFGAGVAGMGDIDGDGSISIAVGASGDDDGGSNLGAVYVLELTGPCASGDADSDGLQDCEEDANTDADNDPATSPGPDTDGDTTPNYLDADDDGDGTATSAENADPNADGDPRDARDIDRDGQPDYLDIEAGPSFTPIADEQKISDLVGGLTATLDDFDDFGRSVTGVGDLDGDGINDVAVGAYRDDDGGTNRGAVYILFLNADGTVKAEQKISDTEGGLAAVLDDGDAFGDSAVGLGDLDGDGVGDVAIGAWSDDDGGATRGAVYILFLNADGTVKAEQKISDTAGGLAATLDDSDYFANQVATLGDLDGDGIVDIAVGANGDDDGGSSRGAVYILFLNADGTVKAEQKISDTQGGLAAVLDDTDQIGWAASGVGDLDGDGVGDLVVGAKGDDDGGSSRGAVYILFLNADGTVKAEQKISDTQGGLVTPLADFDSFGGAVSAVGDLNGDDITDLIVGATGDGGSGRGAVYLLMLDTDGTVKDERKITSTLGGLTGPLDDFDEFGVAVASLGDLDGDGGIDLVVGAHPDDDGGTNRGAVYILDLSPDCSGATGSVSGCPFTSLAEVPKTADGSYWFDFGDGAFQASVDSAEGGGWVQLLQYHHEGGTDPALDIRSAGENWPTYAADALGTDLSATDSWGHAGQAAAASITDSADELELRWFAETNNHTRVIHFRSPVLGQLQADSDPSFFVGGIGTDFTPLGGHTANLPASSSAGYAAQGDETLTNFPYFQSGSYHWGIDGGTTRWEVDDYTNNGSTDTLHRVWVRNGLCRIDTDGDGLWDCEEDANTDADGDPATNPGPDTDGDTTPNYLDPDDDGDGTPTASENADPNGDGDPSDARDSDRDGQPDYLDLPASGSVTPVVQEQKISSTQGGFVGPLADGDNLGESATAIGDLDGDGIVDLAVGALRDSDGGSGRGAVYVLLMNADGTVKAEQKISDTQGGLAVALHDGQEFGTAVAGLGDLDGDNVPDLAVGSWAADGGGSAKGAVEILFLNPDGTVKAEQRIADGEGGLTASLDNSDQFGTAITNVGDLDGDGIIDLAVGAGGDDDGGSGRGAVYVLFLNRTGTVKAEQKISDTQGGLTAALDDFDVFGMLGLDGLGDLDDDGVNDLAVGAYSDDDGGSGRGAVHVLFLNADGTVKAEQKISSTDGGLISPPTSGNMGRDIAGVGDVDGDGIEDLAVGMHTDDDGGTNRGAVYLFSLDTDGTVKAEQKISSTSGGLAGPLDDGDGFGIGLGSLGDLDGDGAINLAVGARWDDDGGSNRGALYILDLAALVDSDGDGLWDHEEDNNTDADNNPATNPGPDTDGDTTPNYLDADDDGDGTPTASENADPNADGDPRDALDVDRDGQPDYLDGPTVAADGRAVDIQKVSSADGGFGGTVANGDGFAMGLTAIGDLDDDGVVDLAVGSNWADGGGSNSGLVHILFMNADQTIRSEQVISSSAGGLAATIEDSDEFGRSVAGIGDIDGDGIEDLAVGAIGDDDGGSGRGAVYILFLNADGTVKAVQKISDTEGGFATTLADTDWFGWDVSGLGDVDGDGVGDLIVGAAGDDDGGSGRGAAYVLFLNADGTVKAEQKISDTAGGLTAILDNGDNFGEMVAGIGDLDGDGINDLVATADGDDDGGTSRGAVYVLFLNADGTVRAEQKISDTDGGLSTALANSDRFGKSVAGIGDVDVDGAVDVLVGASRDNDFGGGGTAFVLFMNTDGTVKAEQEITNIGNTFDADLGSSVAGLGDLDGDGTIGIAIGDPYATVDGFSEGAFYIADLLSPLDTDGDGLLDHWETKLGDTDGDTLPNWNDPDDDGDGTPTASENPDPNADGDARDALDSDRDGEPDYLDGPTGDSNGPIRREQKISSTSGGLTGVADDDRFGNHLTPIGDLNGDGVVDLAVGAPEDDSGAANAGAVHILFMNPGGTVASQQEISNGAGGLTTTIDSGDWFGFDVAAPGDLDGDGVIDLAVGAPLDDDGAGSTGAVYILFLNSDGTVKAEQKISELDGDLATTLDIEDNFGWSVTGVGDVDGDGQNDLAVGSHFDDDGAFRAGAVYILFLNTDGTVKAEQKISDTVGGLTATLGVSGYFGSSVAGIGDLDGDGRLEIAVGTRADDDGAGDAGAVYVLSLNSDGTVFAEQKISATAGGLTATLDASDQFGRSVGEVGDVDGDGIADLLVGAHGDDDGGTGRGAAYLLHMNSDGTVRDHLKYSSTSGGLTGPLDDGDQFGSGLSGIGDLDRDGAIDFAVGAPRDGDGGSDRGAVYVLSLAPVSCSTDADSDGLWDCEEDANTDADGDPSTNPGPDTDGDTLPNYLDADDDGDGSPTSAENADPNADGDPRDARDADRDGQPDYLDVPVTGVSDGSVAGEQKISSTAGGFVGPLDDSDKFGTAASSIGDVDGDGVVDLVVGAAEDDDGGTGRGAIYVVFMNSDGTVKAEQKISSTQGGLAGPLDNFDNFGESVADIGDLDGDGINDIAVGAIFDADGGSSRGAVYVLFLNGDGTVKAEQKISSTQGGLAGPLDDSDRFGSSVSGVGDVDGDGVNDIAVGAINDDDGGSNRGAIYVLLLNSDGSVKAEQKISSTQGGLAGPLDDFDLLGLSVSGVGDLDVDGVVDLAVGVDYDDDGGVNRGAIYVLFLNADGTVKAEQKISSTQGGLAGPLDDWDRFGSSVSGVGDVDADGVSDVAVGAIFDEDGGPSRGAVHVLFLNADGTVKAEQKISSTQGGLAGLLGDSDYFGSSVSGVGDLDGDGVIELVVGAAEDDDGGTGRGAIYVLNLQTLIDSDGDGLWDHQEDANTDADFDPSTNPGPDTDGDTTPNYLDADDDGDGTPTASENADPNADGDPRDALDVDGDGQPDYLDLPTIAARGFVVAEQKISDTAGGLTAVLDDVDNFGVAVSPIGDVDGDGVVDVAVGAVYDDDGGGNAGAVYILFLNADGTVKAEQKISDIEGGLAATLDGGDSFDSVAGVGDIDGDQIPDLAVGAYGDDDGGTNRGAAYILFLNADGTVKAEQKISSTSGGLTGPLDDGDRFGISVGAVGDLDGDGINDVVVGSDLDDDGGTNRGSVYILFLNADGTVKAEQKISDTTGGLTETLDDSDLFGRLVVSPGDVDGDGLADLAVGSESDDDGGTARGAVYILFLNADGTVKAEQKISDTSGGLTPNLEDNDFFGLGLGSVGDLDQDGIVDIAVGAYGDDDGGTDRGAIYILFLNADGTVREADTISSPSGGLTGPIDDGDLFGSDVAGLGDLDGDGTIDIVVGVRGDDDGGSNRGAVYVLDLAPPADSDGDGLWDHQEDNNSDGDGDPSTTPGPDTDGDTLPHYLDADDDGDGTPTVSENPDPNGDGDPRDAADGDHDGQPDYLDLPTGTAGPIVVTEQKIADGQGGLTAALDNDDSFGYATVSIGDLDRDGIVDLATGAIFDDDGGTDRGAIYILLLNADGTVKAEQKISDTVGGFITALDDDDAFGSTIAALGDLDGDGIIDLAVGARGDDDGGTNRGAVYILLLNGDGTVKAEQKISEGTGGFSATLADNGWFGGYGGGIGDLDGDGIPDLAIAAHRSDDLHILFLNADGTVKAEQMITTGTGGLTASVAGDNFGSSVAAIGDLDGDGIGDIAAGAFGDDDGGANTGAIYILFLNADGTVKAEQKIGEGTGGGPTLDSNDVFGTSAAALGDLYNDGSTVLAVGATGDDDGGTLRGALYLLALNSSGVAVSVNKISETSGGLIGPGKDFAEFGSSVTSLGDLDDDGTIGVAVGAYGDDGGTGFYQGAVYVLDLGLDPADAPNLLDDSSIRRSDLATAGNVDPAVPTSGIVADALAYGAGTDRLVAPATDLTSGAWTLSGWVNASSFGTDPRVAAKATADGNAIYELLIDDSSATTGQAMARLKLGGTTHTVSGGSVTTGAWHQLAANWDGSTLSLYLDGLLVDSTPASGSIATDVAVPLVVGNLSAANRGLAGVIDEVRLGHRATGAEQVAFEYANLTSPGTVVSVGAEQTGAVDPWTVSTSQARSGTNAAAAPEINAAGVDAWLTATGLDEPGLAFTTWWWMSTATSVDLAAGTRTGPVATDQYETAVTSTGGWDLATNIGGTRTQQASPAGTPLLGQWVEVEIRTDESGNSSVLVNDSEVIATSAQGSGLLTGSAGLRSGQLPTGEAWYVDDARARKLIAAEPVTSVGPLERQ